MQAKVTIVSDQSARVAALLSDAAARLRQRVVDEAKQRATQHSPEVTGSLKAGYYTVDERGSTYAEAAAAARAANPGVDILPEVPAQEGVSILANCVSHAAVSEFYTGPTNPGSHPSMTPGMEEARPIFEEGIRRLGGDLR